MRLTLLTTLEFIPSTWSEKFSVMTHTAVILNYTHMAFQYYTWALISILLRVSSGIKLMFVHYSEACNSEFYKFYIY